MHFGCHRCDTTEFRVYQGWHQLSVSAEAPLEMDLLWLQESKSPHHSPVSLEVPPATFPKTFLKTLLFPHKPLGSCLVASAELRPSAMRDSTAIPPCSIAGPPIHSAIASLNGAAPALCVPLLLHQLTRHQPSHLALSYRSLCCFQSPLTDTNGVTLGRTQSIDHWRTPCRGRRASNFFSACLENTAQLVCSSEFQILKFTPPSPIPAWFRLYGVLSTRTVQP